MRRGLGVDVTWRNIKKQAPPLSANVARQLNIEKLKIHVLIEHLLIARFGSALGERKHDPTDLAEVSSVAEMADRPWFCIMRSHVPHDTSRDQMPYRIGTVSALVAHPSDNFFVAIFIWS